MEKEEFSYMWHLDGLSGPMMLCHMFIPRLYFVVFIYMFNLVFLFGSTLVA